MIDYKVLNKPLGAGSAPYGFEERRSITAAIVAGVAALGAAIASAVSTNRVNNTNAELSRDQMAFQEEENRKSEQWQEKMWQANNAYNTPSAVMSRYAAAGVNPYLADESLGTGASSLPSTPAKQSAAPLPTMQSMDFSGIGSSAMNLLSLGIQNKGIDAQIANQDAQALKTNIDSIKAAYNISPEFGNKIARMVSGKDMDMNSDTSPMALQLQYQMESMRLDNQRQRLSNMLIDKYGEKEAQNKIALVESEITKNFGTMGLLSSQADLNRSEILLNEKRAYGIGAQIARDMAQARLFTSDARINEGIAQFAIGNMRLQYNSNLINYSDQYADWYSKSGIRDFKMTPGAISRQTWNYKMSPQGNYLNATLNGFTSSLNGVVGVNLGYGVNRSFSTSGSVNTSHIFSHTNQY